MKKILVLFFTLTSLASFKLNAQSCCTSKKACQPKKCCPAKPACCKDTKVLNASVAESESSENLESNAKLVARRDPVKTEPVVAARKQ